MMCTKQVAYWNTFGSEFVRQTGAQRLILRLSSHHDVVSYLLPSSIDISLTFNAKECVSVQIERLNDHPFYRGD